MKLRLILILAIAATFCSGLRTTAWAVVLVDGADPARITVEFTLEDLGLANEVLAGQGVTVVTLAGAQLHQMAGFPAENTARPYPP